MALLRKLFYRKPPDGLLEISERVYVFDICFTTDAWEEDNYKVYIRGIISQLQDHFPDASFLVFNFREGQGQSKMANMLSEYDLTIMDYPRQYEGCPLLTMEVLHHFLRSCESWLQLGQQNLLIMHCERGGWPVLAFVLAALLIYRKQYSGEPKTLDMIYKQAPRELLHLLLPLNPIPSQLRYLQYVSRRNLALEWPSFDRSLTLDCVILRYIPNIDGEGGCRPIFRIYGQDPFLVSDRAAKILFSTPKRSKAVRYYKQAESELVKIDINCHIQGDIVLECFSLHDDMEREEMIFRVAFNTAFIRSNILMLNRDDIDIMWDAKELFPKDFRAEIIFSEMDDASSIISVDFPFFEEKEGLSIDAFSKVHDLFSHVDWNDQRADAARTMLQQIGASNIVHERSDSDKIINLDISSPQMRATSPKKTTQEEMNRVVSPTSPKSPTYWGLQIRLVPSEGPSPKRGFSRHFEVQDSPEKCQQPVQKSQWRDAFASAHHSGQVIPCVKSSESVEDKKGSVLPTTAPCPPPPPAAESLSLSSSVKLSHTSSKVGPSTTFTYPPTPVSEENRSVSSEPVGVSIPPPPPPPLKDPSVRDGCMPSPPLPAKETSSNVASTVPSPPPPPPTQPLKESSPVKACPPPPPPPSLPPKTSASAPPPPPPPAPVSSSSSSKVPCAPPSPASNGGPVPPPPPPASNGGPAPPPPPLGASTNPRNKALSRTISSRNNQSKKLKPLHWLKLTRAVQGSMWAEAQKMGEESKAPEIDIKELETLFSAAVPNPEGAGKAAVRTAAGPKSEKVQLIDHRRAYNCEIMLSKVKMPLPDLMGVVLALDESELDVDQVENIIKFCPTKEEAELLKGYTGDKEKLGKCEQFFLELIKVPRVESKLRVFSFKMQFRSQVADLSRSLNVINSAAEEIKNSVKLKSIMQTILSLGNALNQGTARGSAIGFRLDSLLKLTDTRARNSRMTLMNYLCKVLADKLPEVLDFSKDLPDLEPASRVQLKFLAEEMQAISKGLEKVVQELASSENDGPVSDKFHRILKEFLCHAEGEVRWLASLYSAVGRNVDALILYFGEDPARCPFEQVISTLLNFVRMFNRAHEENCKQKELEMNKAAESEKAKAKESELALQNPPVRGSHVK